MVAGALGCGGCAHRLASFVHTPTGGRTIFVPPVVTGSARERPVWICDIGVDEERLAGCFRRAQTTRQVGANRLWVFARALQDQVPRELGLWHHVLCFIDYESVIALLLHQLHQRWHINLYRIEPQAPLRCGTRPVTSAERDGWQIGADTWHCSNRNAVAAN